MMPSAPWVFRYSGWMASVRTRSSGERMKWAEQSNCAPSHLCGLKTTESAYSTPFPEMAELRADHRRAGPGGVDMDIKAMLAGDRDDRSEIVHRADAGAADAGDDAGRPVSGFDILADRGVERGGVHAAVLRR
jgi:hypothetical protein